MCSTYIQQSMENYQGDLADIIRATGGGGGGGAAGGSTSGEVPAVTDWQFPTDPMNYHPGMIEDPLEDFGHPFSNFRDPLLHELDIPGPSFFGGSGGTADMAMIKSGIEVTGGFGCSGVGGGIVGQKILDEEIKVRPCNIFSRMLQISPNVSPSDSPLMVASPTGLNAPNDMISANSSKSCLMENTGMQISSPRNTGIKRRKSQAKKVVCIPAPAPANSRPTGEIVPSDLWAWRKYGQKPIKGSPYPRGYYRCSSSKGCSARKQVERSRTDPNMLVITYTSEHNHPWPTQRNALAGSTRTQPTKSNNSSNTSKNSTSSQTQKVPRLKEEQHKEINTTTTNVTNPPVKEEMEDLDKQIDMDDDDDGGDQYSYRPALPDSNHAEDFFADLGEIEADPLSHLFNQGFTAEEERENNKGLDPFSFYDWTVNNNNNNT